MSQLAFAELTRLLEESTVGPFEQPTAGSLEQSKQADWSGLEDSSPFGLQGLARQSLQIIKSDCITRLAARIALRANPEQIQDIEYVKKVLSWHPEWVDEYQIVHLIEKSLWIQGHSDLVMTMTRNPSQIPDNPPEKIKQALTRAYLHHPDANIWYGVPLFGDAKTEDGLPIPVTADEVRAEANRRLEAVQQHALKWRWAYRTALTAASVPSVCWYYGLKVKNRVQRTREGVNKYFAKCRHDARMRARAIYMRDLEYCRRGCSMTEIPEHRTWLGQSLETACVILELIAFQASSAAAVSPLIGLITAPLAIAHFIPLIFVPLTIVSCDPFLFVELREEPGKLRHIGHWYWQEQPEGEQKLHLHV